MRAFRCALNAHLSTAFLTVSVIGCGLLAGCGSRVKIFEPEEPEQPPCKTCRLSLADLRIRGTWVKSDGIVYAVKDLYLRVETADQNYQNQVGIKCPLAGSFEVDSYMNTQLKPSDCKAPTMGQPILPKQWEKVMLCGKHNNSEDTLPETPLGIIE